MRIFTKKISKKTGLPPGTLVHIGEKKVESVRIRVMDYDAKRLEEKEVTSIEECFPYKERSTITWINIDGLHDVDSIQKMGKHFGIHPLVLEDIVHTEQRPKVEVFEDYVFIISKMLSYDVDTSHIIAEQFSLILGPDYVLSFQERYGDIFNPVQERIRKGDGRIRKMGADYLMYALVDAIVDNYFGVLEKVGVRLEALEENLIPEPGSDILQAIHHFRRELIFLRKFMWPLRELIGHLENGQSDLIHEKTMLYLRDVHDHILQIIDMIYAFSDMVSGIQDLYFSGLSNRMNEVMKVLTIVATIFIPLTFIAGIYGMNFKYMPELDWPWGYPLALVVMLVILVIMVLWFKRKRFF